MSSGAPNEPLDRDRYKWIALSNTTLATLIATIDLVGRPDRAAGHLPRDRRSTRSHPGNTTYLLWLMMGFMIVTAVLVVTLGRLGDIYGRVRIYNLGFVDLHGLLDPAVGHVAEGQPRRRSG